MGSSAVKRSEDRILTTHVGSLARPGELIANPVLGDGMRGDGPPPTTAGADPRVLRRAVADVVRRQAEVGIDIINDGEFGKSSWSAYIMGRITGFELRQDQLRRVEWLGRDQDRFGEYLAQTYPNFIKGTPTEACVGPIAYRDHTSIRRDLANFKDALRSVDVADAFFTAVAPASTAYDGVNEYYPNDHDYVFAIAEALREEYLDVYNAGLLVQVDDAVLANMFDALMQKSKKHYREWAEVRIEALNHALRGIPEDRVRYHVCFGSWHLPHTSDAPLEEIIDLILRVKAGAYSIEAANVRHEHEWHVWEKVKLPPGKILIPGVITHHTISVEHPQLVADRIVQFARLVGRESVIAGTDCGFAQVEFIQRVHPSVMWAKFESLVAGARLASKTLWGR
jgi:5-methyltetrahydropteroyltriglutamate--homocysteine methyltransferase